jgi:D-tagatose-1,6-bisphosphate aldolase subunit GatZ/KbaZ
MQALLQLIAANRRGEGRGIYAICSAHPLVIEAAIEQAKQDETLVLIEATANQVNQYGGYTAMQPADFPAFVYGIAERLDFPRERIILGGDHLGPVCWVNETAAVAMEKARTLIADYVAAGFHKIHLDTSMRCCDDPSVLADDIIAQRAAELCLIAEQTAIKHFGQANLVYIVGTEVPPPGGASEEIAELTLTPASRVSQTLICHQKAFASLMLDDAWQRVVGVVVQPGVEFDHTSIIDYQSANASELKHCITTLPNVIYEAHSTDYQNENAYIHLIRDHFAILKVGPQLTLALREAIFALSYIEDELIPCEQRSYIRKICEQEMLESPKFWQNFYHVPVSKGSLYRRFSYSDRIRYYWHNPRVSKAVCRLFENLTTTAIPLPLLSQFLPEQYRAIRNNRLRVNASPQELVKAKIKQVTEVYSQACWKQCV